MTARSLAFCAACCAALALASLVVPASPVYDAWAWLVWGRELAHGGLDLSTGPSWKPLPVGVTTVLAAAGDAAPALWLVVVRAAWLLAIVLAADLAYRLASGHGRRERLAAAAFAATALLLLHDPFTAWLRQAGGGMSEPLLVALVLGAVRAGLDDRHRLALALAALGALLRPEVWPLLALYGLWLWRRDRALRPVLVALAVAIPVLWLGPDLLTGADALTGAERAQRAEGSDPQSILDVLGRAALLPLAVAWPLAALAVARRTPRLGLLLAGALAWVAIVALMTVAGFWGLPRFLAPAAAIVCVLGGVGFASLLALAPEGGLRRPAPPAVALGVVLVALVVQVTLRGVQLTDDAQAVVRIGHAQERLREAVGRDAVRSAINRCGLRTGDVLVRPAIAWKLDVRLADVLPQRTRGRLEGVVVVGPQTAPRLRRRLAIRGPKLLAVRGEWRVYSLGCPAPASASASARSTGVSGARR